MDYNAILNGLKRFGSNENDICLYGTGVSQDSIRENVVIAPWWEPSSLSDLGDAEYIGDSELDPIKVWNVTNGECEFTYIKTGIGAPVLMDAVLSLGVTKCKNIIFIGSVGSLNDHIHIGDVVIPEWSICGDGASRYLSDGLLVTNDVFGEKVYPNKNLLDSVWSATSNICESNHVNYHIGQNYSTDTVVAQFAHIDEILSMGCNVIEMETAAAFRAAKLASISMAAFFAFQTIRCRRNPLSAAEAKEKELIKEIRRESSSPKFYRGLFGITLRENSDFDRR